ncbi:hypothetical protein [Mycobacterium sp. ITM-2016-00318]|uniref:hypothetical protein n=1 Tax=Mycobacterium sp. ITM-2016-00318 TaxID=2099693 RepID=UPI00115A9B4D|nr:hypothetical protein [Mycobacterium sp. ITM-2016-00318]WNG93670.1 hypothetical protein C6A82_004155 [Mycobacterium sp. ITM-2016-00318]
MGVLMATDKRSKGLVAPRLRRILCHPNWLVSLLLGLFAFFALTYVRIPPRHPEVKVVELSGAILTFTSMGFAVSLTAVALILAMPLGRTTALLVVNSRGAPPVQVVQADEGLEIQQEQDSPDSSSEQRETAYLELVAVFLITAIANVFSSAAVIVWSTAIGGDSILSSHTIENSILTAIVAMLVGYSAAQMLTAIRTLYQVAVLIQGVMRSQLD